MSVSSNQVTVEAVQMHLDLALWRLIQIEHGDVTWM